MRTVEADRALAIVADVARNAALPDEELERQRAIARRRGAGRDERPGRARRHGVGARALRRWRLWPAARTADLARAPITREDLQAAYRDAWAPDSATLILTGDIDAGARAGAGASGISAAGARPRTRRAAISAERPAPRTDIIVIDMPGAGQAAVAVARNALHRRDPRYYRALVANAVLGGGYSARLNQEIRIRRGLSYGAGQRPRRARAPGARSWPARRPATTPPPRCSA